MCSSDLIDLHALMTLDDPLPPHYEQLTAQITVQLATTRLAAQAFTTGTPADEHELWQTYTALRREAAALAALLNDALQVIPFERVPGLSCVTTASVIAYLTVPRDPRHQRETQP